MHKEAFSEDRGMVTFTNAAFQTLICFRRVGAYSHPTTQFVCDDKAERQNICFATLPFYCALPMRKAFLLSSTN